MSLADRCLACRLPFIVQMCKVCLRQTELGVLPVGCTLATLLLKEYGETASGPQSC